MRGPAKRLTLSAIAAAEVPLSARELARVMYGPEYRPAADTENVSRTVKRLVAEGLVEHAGWSPLGARTWRLTDAGREAMKTLPPEAVR